MHAVRIVDSFVRSQSLNNRPHAPVVHSMDTWRCTRGNVWAELCSLAVERPSAQTRKTCLHEFLSA